MEFAILSLILYGVQNTGFKISSKAGVDSLALSKYFLLGVCLVSLPLVLSELSGFSPALLILAVCNGVFFAVGTWAKMKSLENMELGRFYPVFKLNILIPIAFSVVFLSESFEIKHAVGLLFAFLAIYFSVKK